MMDSCADGPFGILNWVSIVYSDVHGFPPKPPGLHKYK